MIKQRNSSIEILKVIAMIMIVFFHCYLTVTTTHNSFYPVLEAGIDFANYPKGMTKLVLLMMGYFGCIGNLIFIICAAWFLYDTDTIRLDKIISIVLTTLVISILNLITIHRLFPEVSLSTKYIHDSFFPISYGHNWFISCYLMLYIMHGSLNKAIRAWDRNIHLLVASTLFFVYSVVTLYARTNFYYSSKFIVCVMLYILVSYVKRYMHELHCGKRMIQLGSLGFIGIVVLKQLGFPSSIKDQGLLLWAKISNPFLILIVLGGVVIASGRCFYSFFINDMSAMSLELYLIHENSTFKSVVRPILWNDMSGTFEGLPLLLRFFIFSIVILAYGLSASILFSAFITPHLSTIAKVVSGKLCCGWKKFTNKIQI